MRRYTLFTAIFWLLSLSITVAQQDPLIGSYQFNQSLLNPAYAGANDITSIDLHYRSQWGGIDGAPTSFIFTGNTSLKEDQLGLGFALIRDEIGITQNTGFSLNLGYEVRFTEKTKLSFGLGTLVMSLKYDFAKLNLEDATDEDFVAADNQFSKLNFGSGLFLSNERFYLGLSIPRILKVTEEINENRGERFNRHYYLSGGAILGSELSTVRFKPYALLSLAENSPSAIDVGFSALLENMIWLGLFNRNFQDIGISATLMLESGLRLGYIGEISAGDSPTSNFSTHEITIGIDLSIFGGQVGIRNF